LDCFNKGGFAVSRSINVKQVKRCVTCKLWHGDAVIDYNAKTGMVRFNEDIKARCDFWKSDKQAWHTCPKHQIENRYL